MTSPELHTGRPVHPDPSPRPGFCWSDVLDDLIRGRELSATAAEWATTEIVRGAAAESQISAFLTGLRIKGETAAEIDGCVRALLAHAQQVTITGPIADIAGTGGDRTGAINISTLAAIVAAATGVTMIKHGGRAATSRSAGSADLLEHFGVRLELTAAQAARVAARAGIAFLFAPSFNPGLRHAARVRRELGVPTIFNAAAPLINPARPRQQLVGVADPQWAPILAGALVRLGRGGLVVRGRDGLDKITTTGVSDLWEVSGGVVTTTTLDPREFGIALVRPEDLRGGSAADNARTAVRLLDGAPGPIRDVVLLNAAAVRATVESSTVPVGERIGAAVHRCADAIDSGAARATLDRLVRATRSHDSRVPEAQGQRGGAVR